MKLVALGCEEVFYEVVTALLDAGIEIAAIWDTPCTEVKGQFSVPRISTLAELERYEFDLVLACWFYDLIPQEIVDKYVIVNMHGGLLPEYRGSHGNGWAMINGDTEIGYTLHRMDASIDGGPIIYQKKFMVSDSDTYGAIKEKMIEHFKANIAEVLIAYHTGNLQEEPQDLLRATFAGKRNIRDCYINWSQPSKKVHDFVRTLAPPVAPGAFTIFRNEKLVILETEPFPTRSYHGTPGQVVYQIPDKGVLVKTGDGVIMIKKVLYRGEKKSPLQVFKTVGARLGVDLIGEKLKELKIL